MKQFKILTTKQRPEVSHRQYKYASLTRFMIYASPTLKQNRPCLLLECCHGDGRSGSGALSSLDTWESVGNDVNMSPPPHPTPTVAAKTYLHYLSACKPSNTACVETQVTHFSCPNSVPTLSVRLEAVQVALLPVSRIQLLLLLEELGAESGQMPRNAGRSGGD